MYILVKPRIKAPNTKLIRLPFKASSPLRRSAVISGSKCSMTENHTRPSTPLKIAGGIIK